MEKRVLQSTSNGLSLEYKTIEYKTDVKLMLGKVLQVSPRNLPPFLSYRENPAGGDICPPPTHSSGARVMVQPVCKYVNYLMIISTHVFIA